MENNYQAMVDKKAQCHINSLHVYCINNKEGCGWKGELKDLTFHLQQGKREGECQYVRVQCKYREYKCKCHNVTNIFQLIQDNQQYPFKTCEFTDKRYKLNTHETNDCPNRPYICQYCGYDNTYVNITEKHYSECHSYPVSCPNECKQDKMPRIQRKDHLNTSCPLQPVECEFSWAGCKVKPKRQDLPKHCSDNIQIHLSLVARACQELKKENELLKRENAKIKERLKMK